MLLADKDIIKAIDELRIIIRPKPDFAVALSACTLDLRLGNEFQLFDHSKIPFFDTKKGDQFSMKKMEIVDDEPFILHPGEFVIAATKEWIELPDDIAGRLEGRSSLARLGIVVHSTAALFHPGFRGNAVLELGNHSRMPLALYPGMRICSLSFEMLTQKAAKPYHSQKGAKYAGQKGAVGSKIQDD